MDTKVIYEPETLRIFDEVLDNGDQVLIAGAHQGFFACHCSKLVGSSGKIFAFEPESFNRDILVEKTKDLDNVEVFPFALGDRETTARFYINSDNDGGHALWDISLNPNNHKTQSNKQIISAEVKTIDDFFENEDLSRLKLLMLDAEGSEHAILRGGINTIVDNEVPFIICEINNFALKQCATSQISLRNYLAMYGFTGYVMNEDSLVDCEKNEVKAFMPDTEQEVVFNMLFSRRGKI